MTELMASVCSASVAGDSGVRAMVRGAAVVEILRMISPSWRGLLAFKEEYIR